MWEKTVSLFCFFPFLPTVTWIYVIIPIIAVTIGYTQFNILVFSSHYFLHIFLCLYGHLILVLHETIGVQFFVAFLQQGMGHVEQRWSLGECQHCIFFSKRSDLILILRDALEQE